MTVASRIIETPHLFDGHFRDVFVRCGHASALPERLMVIIDEQVDDLYGDRIRRFWHRSHITPIMVRARCDEHTKNMATLTRILEKMAGESLLRRAEPVIAIGGGILLDIAGLAANLYRRGVPYIRIPTTLVGLVDAGIGAKTGVNGFSQRNRIGTYYPPLASFIDISFLATLPVQELRNGFSEILKLAIVVDRQLFELVEIHGEDLLETRFQGHPAADDVIQRAITGMAAQLDGNLWEQNLARYVDFGHSFSPFIEMKSRDTDEPLSHGEAVILDVYLSCVIANNRGMLADRELRRVCDVMDGLGLKAFHPLFSDMDMLGAALEEITTHRNGRQNCPLPTEIGRATFYNDIGEADLAQAVMGDVKERRV